MVNPAPLARNALPPSRPSVLVAPGRVEAAMMKLEPALAVLAGALAAHGEPADAPFERFGAPSLVFMASLDAAAAADAAIALVRAVFRMRRMTMALTVATKSVGNAARGVRRALAREAARAGAVAEQETPPSPAKAAAKLAA
jgi:hypothetical protein